MGPGAHDERVFGIVRNLEIGFTLLDRCQSAVRRYIYLKDSVGVEFDAGAVPQRNDFAFAQPRGDHALAGLGQVADGRQSRDGEEAERNAQALQPSFAFVPPRNHPTWRWKPNGTQAQ